MSLKGCSFLPSFASEESDGAVKTQLALHFTVVRHYKSDIEITIEVINPSYLTKEMEKI